MQAEPAFSARALPVALWLGLGVPAVFAAHAAAMFALYAAGVRSSLLLFALPFAAALAGYFFVARASGVFNRRIAACGALALLLACLSCCGGMAWAFTTFGT